MLASTEEWSHRIEHFYFLPLTVFIGVCRGIKGVFMNIVTILQGLCIFDREDTLENPTTIIFALENSPPLQTLEKELAWMDRWLKG